MSEFNNRINAQREALRLVNSLNLYEEPLLSLTDKSINRWVINNNISSNDSVVCLLREISGRLFFLANKSQEQITEEYSRLSDHVDGLINELRIKLTGRQM